MKQVNEMKGPKSTTAWALLYEGKEAGRVIANWSDNPAGTVCSASVIVFHGPLAEYGFGYDTVGRAGGYGYDKLSQAVWQCFDKVGCPAKVVRPANGQTRDEFEAWGYTVIEVL